MISDNERERGGGGGGGQEKHAKALNIAIGLKREQGRSYVKQRSMMPYHQKKL